MSRSRRIILVVATLAALAGCSSTIQQPPVGPGRGAEELKLSPCACTPIPMHLPSGVAVQPA